MFSVMLVETKWRCDAFECCCFQTADQFFAQLLSRLYFSIVKVKPLFQLATFLEITILYLETGLL